MRILRLLLTLILWITSLTLLGAGIFQVSFGLFDFDADLRIILLSYANIKWTSLLVGVEILLFSIFINPAFVLKAMPASWSKLAYAFACLASLSIALVVILVCENAAGVNDLIKADSLSGMKQFELLHEVADKGNASGANNLALIYERGYLNPEHAALPGFSPLPTDLRKAVYYFEASRNAGSTAASFNLGRLYMEGKGVPRSPLLALYLYREAAASDNDTASSLAKEQIRKAMTIIESDPENRLVFDICFAELCSDN